MDAERKLIEEAREFCSPLCVMEDTKEAQAADYALQAADALEAALERGKRGWELAHGAASAIENLPVLEAEEWLHGEWLASYNASVPAAGSSSLRNPTQDEAEAR